jgi:hypothetical protein
MIYSKYRILIKTALAIVVSCFMIGGLSSCSLTPEVTDINLDNSDKHLVVEGLITDQPGPYSVKLSLSTNFYNKEIERVEDAFVTITDNLGNRDVLTRSEAGLYQTDSLEGKIGNTYTLTVIYNGQTYSSVSRMTDGITIDSVNYIFQKETLVFDEGYYLNVFGTEAPEEGNYYRWYIAEDDTLDKDILLDNDKFLNRRIENVMIQRAFDKGDKARIEVHSLSEEEYKYYIGLQNVLDNDGGFFSSPPKNPIGNISNGALGIFRASKVSSKEVVIE